MEAGLRGTQAEGGEDGDDWGKRVATGIPSQPIRDEESRVRGEEERV